MEVQRTAKVHSPHRSEYRQKRSRTRLAWFAVLPLAAVIGQALANPDVGVVVGGQATINQKPGITTVDQSSDRAIINWRGFSIDPGELTRFNQPGKDAVALNRVLGRDPSKLLGQLKANGHVWLVNPNGILFGPSARVDVHGLLATTADIHDQDFLAGHNNFSIPSPNADASVVNQGNISIGQHGLGGLVAPHVRNAGLIQGRLGQVVIAGAPTFTLDFYGDGLIQFEATSKVTENTNPADPLVRNDGKISVEGGDVLITANAAAGVVDEAINMDGIVEARSVGMENGSIVLKGGDEGIVHVAGQLDASGAESGTTGGSVDVLGDNVLIADGARINVSGSSGGGTTHIGGDLHGEGDRPTASQTIVTPEAQIEADAIDAGDGGQVVVWADDSAEIHGQIIARGGAVSGDGGLIETSGKKNLTLTSSPDASAPHGKGGTWLIDPANITIVAGVGGAIGSNTVGADLINDALNTGTSVTLDTRDTLPLPDNNEPGDINQENGATISKTAGGEATLTLEAENNITLVDNITSTANELNLDLLADSDESGEGSISISLVTINTNGGDITARSNNTNVSALPGSTGIAGIDITGSDINSVGGGINLIGNGGREAQGGDDIFVNFLGHSGVELTRTVIDSGGGEIILNGVGGNGAINDGGIGIFLNDSTRVSSGDGPIRLSGIGGNGRTGSEGISIFSSIVGSDGGQISLIGTGGNALSSGGSGILISSNSNIIVRNGDIELIGSAGASTEQRGDGSDGIDLALNSVVETTGIGTIGLMGSGGLGATNGNIGIIIQDTGSKLLSENGDINLTGNGGGNTNSGNNDGISIFRGGAIETTGSGNVNLIGFAGNGTTDNQGIAIGRFNSGANSQVTAAEGNINMTGLGQGADQNPGFFGNHGILIFDSAIIEAIGVGSISLEGAGPSGASGIISASVPLGDASPFLPIAIKTGSGTTTLTADEIDLAQLTQVSGSGFITLQQRDPSLGISLGGTTSDDRLNLDSIELATLQDGFSRIFIGRTDGTGPITLDSAGVTFNDSLTLQSPGPGGNITSNGPIQVNSGDLALIAGDTIVTSVEGRLILGGNLEMVAGSGIDVTTENLGRFAASTASGDINIDNLFGANTIIGSIGDTAGVSAANGGVIIDVVGNLTVDEPITAGDFARLRAREIEDTAESGDILVNATITAGFGSDGSGLPDASLRADRHIILNSGSDLTVARRASLFADRNFNGRGVIDNLGNTSISLSTLLSLGAAEGIGTTNPIQTRILEDSRGLFGIEIDADTDTGDIRIANISVEGADAGSVSLIRSEGSNFTTDGLVSVINSSGNVIVNTFVQGGEVELTSSSLIDVNADVLSTNGAIDISSDDTVDTTGGNLGSIGGNVTIFSRRNIDTSNVFTGVDQPAAGDIRIISSEGTIDTTAGELNTEGDFDTADDPGGAGAVLLEAFDDISTSNIFASSLSGDGGNITLISNGGSMDTSAGDLTAGAVSGSGGTVTLTALGDISTGDISLASSEGRGGAIDLNSNGNIVAGSMTLGSISGLVSDPLTADAPGTIEIVGLTPNAADINIGTQTRPGNLLLPNAIDTSGGNVTLFVGNEYIFATDLITNQGNFTLDSPQALTLAAPIQTNGGDVTVQSGGALTLEAPIVTSIDQALILLVADGDFVNRVGENGLQPGDGRYLVYSDDPADDTRGIPDDQINKRYSFTFDPDDTQGIDEDLPAEGNFFLYEIIPTLTIIADDGSRDFGEPNPAFTFTSIGLIDGDTLETSLSEPPVLTTTAVETSPPDHYLIAVGPRDLSSPVGYALESKPGTLTVTQNGLPRSTELELPSSAQPPAVGDRVVPVVPLVLTNHPDPTFAVPAVGSLTDSNDLLSPNDGNRELWGPPR